MPQQGGAAAKGAGPGATGRRRVRAAGGARQSRAVRYAVRIRSSFPRLATKNNAVLKRTTTCIGAPCMPLWTGGEAFRRVTPRVARIAFLCRLPARAFLAQQPFLSHSDPTTRSEIHRLEAAETANLLLMCCGRFIRKSVLEE